MTTTFRSFTAIGLTSAALLAGCASEPEAPPVRPSLSGTFQATVNGEPWSVDAQFGPLTTFGEPPDNYTGLVAMGGGRTDSSEFGPHTLEMMVTYHEFEQGDVLSLRLPRDDSGFGQGVEFWEGEGGNLVNSYIPVEGAPGQLRITTYDAARGVLQATLEGTFAATFPGNGPHPGYTDTIRVVGGAFDLTAETP